MERKPRRGRGAIDWQDATWPTSAGPGIGSSREQANGVGRRGRDDSEPGTRRQRRRPRRWRGNAARDVTLATSKAPVVYGSGFVLTGKVITVAAASNHCVSEVDVSIVRDSYNDMPYFWYEVVRVKTDEGGTFRVALMAENSANYRAEVQEVPFECAAARSKRVVVRSRVHVTLDPLTTSVDRGEVVRLVAKVGPACAEKVVLQKLTDGRFVRVGSKAPNDRCVAVFRRRVHDDSVFRARHREFGSAGFFYLANRSALTAISVRG